MSLIVRNEGSVIGTEQAVGAERSRQTSSKRWVSFSPSDARDDGERFPDRYRVEAVCTVKGAPFNFGPEVAGAALGGLPLYRREVAGTRRPTGFVAPFSGVIDPRHSSSDEEAHAHVASWGGNPFRVAVLIACAHDARFAALKADDRTFDHLATPDTAVATRVSALRRIIRHLHRASDASLVGQGWDSFAYLEMLPHHVAPVREYLAERRELSRVSRLVDRLTEVWMVKQLDGTDAPVRMAGA